MKSDTFRLLSGRDLDAGRESGQVGPGPSRRPSSLDAGGVEPATKNAH